MKHTAKRILRTSALALASSTLAFLIGIQTAGDVQTVKRSEASDAEENAFIRGDADQNGVLDAQDAITVLDISQGWTDGDTETVLSGDMDDDAVLTAIDVLLILRSISQQ